MSRYSVDDGNGDRLSTGMNRDDARALAKRHANATGQACLVYADDTVDDDEVVDPD